MVEAVRTLNRHAPERGYTPSFVVDPPIQIPKEIKDLLRDAIDSKDPIEARRLNLEAAERELVIFDGFDLSQQRDVRERARLGIQIIRTYKAAGEDEKAREFAGNIRRDGDVPEAFKREASSLVENLVKPD